MITLLGKNTYVFNKRILLLLLLLLLLLQRSRVHRNLASFREWPQKALTRGVIDDFDNIFFL